MMLGSVKVFVREIIIYLVILVVAAILMHQGDLPNRLGKALDDPSNFGHAVLYAALFYLLVLTLRFILLIIKKIRERGRDV